MNIGESLEKQVGPFPLGVWILVIGGGLGIGLYARRHVGGASTATDDAGYTTSGGTEATVGNLYQPTTTVGQGSLATTPLIETNEDWRTAALRELLARNYAPTLADSAITKYLTGSSLSSAEQALIDIALQYAGPTPYLVPAPIVSNTPITPVVQNPAPDDGDTNTPVVDNTPTIPAPAPAPAPPAAAISVPVPPPAQLPPAGVAVQIPNPIPKDNSVVVVGTTPQGNGYVYGGSQAQASMLTAPPVDYTKMSWWGKKVDWNDPNVPMWYKLGFSAPRFAGDV